MDEIAEQIGCKPNIKHLFKEDPKLALHCLCGPCFPAQYRLRGPGKWRLLTITAFSLKNTKRTN
jgi:dimethylaniline monooxygenase (N-oxide forming)